MKSYLLFATLNFLAFTGFSQSEFATTTPKRFSYGLYFSPNLNYRTLTSNATNNLVKATRDQEEIADFGFRAGMTFDYRISKKIDLSSGLIFSNRTFRTRSKRLVWSKSNASEAFISQLYSYVDIPLKVRYNISPDQKLNWFVSGGANLAFLPAHVQRNHTNTSGTWKVSRDRLNTMLSFLFLAEIEAGVAYRLTPAFTLRSSLYFQHALTSTNPNFNTREFLYSGGFSVGLIFTPQKEKKQ